MCNNIIIKKQTFSYLFCAEKQHSSDLGDYQRILALFFRNNEKYNLLYSTIEKYWQNIPRSRLIPIFKSENERITRNELMPLF